MSCVDQQETKLDERISTLDSVHLEIGRNAKLATVIPPVLWLSDHR